MTIAANDSKTMYFDSWDEVKKAIYFEIKAGQEKITEIALYDGKLISKGD